MTPKALFKQGLEASLPALADFPSQIYWAYNTGRMFIGDGSRVWQRNSIAFKGAYSGSTTYQKLDAVTYNGSTWLALRTVTGVTPVEGADWTVLAAKGDPGGVASFGPSGSPRTGVVLPASGDYSASQITNTPAGNIGSNNLQGAVNELDTEKSNVGHAHAGEEITSGTIAVARIGTGTKDATTFYRGDGTFASGSSGAYYKFSRAGSLVAPITGGSWEPVMEARTLNAFRVYLDVAVTVSTVFSLKRRTSGGTVTELATVTLAPGATATQNTATGLSIALADGDGLRMDVTSGGTGGSGATGVAKAA